MIIGFVGLTPLFFAYYNLILALIVHHSTSISRISIYHPPPSLRVPLCILYRFYIDLIVKRQSLSSGPVC